MTSQPTRTDPTIHENILEMSDNGCQGGEPPFDRRHDIVERPVQRALPGRCRETETTAGAAIAERLADAAGTGSAAPERIQAGRSHVHRPTMVDPQGSDDDPNGEMTRPAGTTETTRAVMGRGEGGDAE